MKDNSKKKPFNEATVAPGIDDSEELNQEATKREVQKGDYTEVTSLSLDEVNPS